MSSVVSSVLVLLLFVALAAPAALAGVGGARGRGTAAFYTLLVIAILTPYASLPASRVPEVPRFASPSSASPSSPDAENGPCEQALATAHRNGVILDRSAPGQLVVRQEIWRMLPQNLRTMLTDCAGQLNSSGGESAAVEVIERAR